MKKRLILSIIAVLAITSSAFAGGRNVNIKTLRIGKVLVEDYSLTSGDTVTSDTVTFKGNTGYSTLLVTENKSGGAGDVDIWAEYCLKSCSTASNWHRIYTSDMAGAITIEGEIVTALQDATRWIVFTARMAPNVRFVFAPDADSQISATAIYQEQY